MIKTHRPRGHIWTHASAFQQTEEFRDIRFDGCLAPTSKILVKDPDDKLSPIERSGKRQRIEKLADDFLNGSPLFISSARPGPQSLRSTIIRDNTDPEYVKTLLSNSEHASNSPASTAIWANLEDDDEVLKRLTAGLRIQNYPKPHYGTSGVDRSKAVAVINVQASCKPRPRLKGFKVTTGPSEEALRQAAMLRARKHLRAHSEVPVVRRRSSEIEQYTENVVEPQSEPQCALF